MPTVLKQLNLVKFTVVWTSSSPSPSSSGSHIYKARKKAKRIWGGFKPKKLQSLIDKKQQYPNLSAFRCCFVKVQLIASSTASNSNLEGNMSWRASWFKGITGGISCQGSLNRSGLQHLQCKGLSNLYNTEENGFTHQFSLLTILVSSATRDADTDLFQGSNYQLLDNSPI